MVRRDREDFVEGALRLRELARLKQREGALKKPLVGFWQSESRAI
jgi:hypothetical protein